MGRIEKVIVLLCVLAGLVFSVNSGAEVLASGRQPDLSRFIDSIIRSDKKVYEALVKVTENYGEKKISFEEGEVLIVQPQGHSWGVSEREKFLIMQVYLTEEEAYDIGIKTAATGEVDESGNPVFARKKWTINLKQINFTGKKFSQVRELLKNNILSKDIIEEKMWGP